MKNEPEGAASDPGALQKRSVLIAGHSTSVSLEAAFWDALKAIAASRCCSVNALVERIDGTRSGNLSSALRVFVLRQVGTVGANRSSEEC